MKKSILLSALLALPLLGLTTAAQAAGGAIVDVDLHVSTLGGGLGLAFPVTDSVALRAGFNKFNKTYTTTSGGGSFDGEVKLSSFDLLADWHPFNGVFHLTGGLVSNGNKLTMNATPDAAGNITINNVAYNNAQLTGAGAEVAFKKVVPYLGIGWSGQAKNKGFSFKSDIGVLFQGSPQATLTVTGPQANNAAVVSNVAAAQDQLNTDLSNFKLYPVISFGIGYAF